MTGESRAQFTYSKCAAPTADQDFASTTLINRAIDADIFEPLKMDFHMDAQGKVNVFFIERKGAIKYYDATAKTVRIIGQVQAATTGEDGLVGFALDPEFKTKKRLFAYYAHTTGFRLSRFDLDPATLDLKPASEKILLTIPSGRGRWHTSGAMRFDAYGDLYINAGDNESLLKGPANMADWRGSILRIHPKEDGTYSIPTGNLWETASKYFEGKNMASVAAKYKDPALARREIFVKGVRNPYTLTVDPVRRWATWGDCGPDQESSSSADTAVWTEEHNVATEPGFYGWPFWTARNHVQKVFPPGYDEAGEKDAWKDWSTQQPSAPVNPLASAGIAELPPARTGTHIYPHSCAMTGPIYRYDGSLASAYKLPPSMNRLWFVTDFNNGKIKALRLTADGRQSGPETKVFENITAGPNFKKPLDFQVGPDGALYYLNYSCGPWYTADACTGIYRIEYKGTCQDPALLPESVTALASGSLRDAGVEIRDGILSLRGQGGYALALYDMTGKAVRSFSSEGPKEYRVGGLLAGARPGIYFVRVESPEGKFTGRVSHFP